MEVAMLLTLISFIVVETGLGMFNIAIRLQEYKLREKDIRATNMLAKELKRYMDYKESEV